MNSTIENFKKYKPLLFELVSRDLKTKYRRSVLGVLWTVLNPLGMMLVMTVVFSTVFRQNIENFPVYLMCGQLVFNFFNEASNMAMTSILGNASLIKKVYVPKYLFPLSRVCSSLVNMLTSFIALIIVIIVTRTPVTWTIITAVFPVLYVSMFAFGVGLVLATAVVTFRDLQHLYGVVITAWLYLTPIFYPISMLPESIGRLIKLNPITSFVELLRYQDPGDRRFRRHRRIRQGRLHQASDPTHGSAQLQRCHHRSANEKRTRPSLSLALLPNLPNAWPSHHLRP